MKAGAGPSYGVYPLGVDVDCLLENPERHLRTEGRIWPRMSDSEWSWAAEVFDILNDDVSDEEFDTTLIAAFSGLLPINPMGCTFYSALVVAGRFRGRVVAVDLNYTKPFFTDEANFLDWYEKWLDDVIIGELPKWRR